ncbi:DUF3618 domain-containing protein [Streptomyces sp. WMMB303]|uniref:DUF3618 domain-containing protein n=1 Tax=Streptomyces sp. WMMB303 TaxID=3034154 RepID=UPI0023ECD883|nr:DUF3618 domain-containing protein [Streptomyces sp. WMMB303]MDF4251457.1 DUF3618 domain-containing protein [Streptomyces sp. WMMB303]
MTQSPHSDGSAPSPAELRAQVEETRRELGETVEALAARADIKAHGQRKTAELKARARHAGETTRGGTLPAAGGAALMAAALFLRHARRKHGGAQSSPAIRQHAAGGRRRLGVHGHRAGPRVHRPGGGSTRRHRPGQRPA